MRKQNHKQKRLIKKMIRHLEDMLGEYDAGLFLSMVCDLLDTAVKGRDYLELRTLEIVLNNFFRVKYDFEKDDIVDGR